MNEGCTLGYRSSESPTTVKAIWGELAVQRGRVRQKQLAEEDGSEEGLRQGEEEQLVGGGRGAKKPHPANAVSGDQGPLGRLPARVRECGWAGATDIRQSLAS